ncbi:MAG: hypothetical protein FJW68_05640 [Actinobacteria bacterium]|nr:hypothetical protein [Actinomycetota bacterium]
MKIKFKIQGIHCKGCLNLIKLTLEEYGFTDVDIDIAEATGIVHDNERTFDEAKKDINTAFAEMEKCTVADIKQI